MQVYSMLLEKRDIYIYIIYSVLFLIKEFISILFPFYSVLSTNIIWKKICTCCINFSNFSIFKTKKEKIEY